MVKLADSDDDDALSEEGGEEAGGEEEDKAAQAVSSPSTTADSSDGEEEDDAAATFFLFEWTLLPTVLMAMDHDVIVDLFNTLCVCSYLVHWHWCSTNFMCGR